MRRHLEGIDLATTPALLRRATPGKYLVRLSAWCYNSRSPAENDGMCYTLMTRDNTRYNSRSPAESDSWPRSRYFPFV